MIGNKSVLGVVPARAGSKGLPGKNIRLLCGKPLIVWTIEAALGAKYVDEVLVSTDGEEIARIAKASGASVPFLRPARLATDTASSFDVVVHAIDFYRDNLKRSFDYIVLLEPTSPLRERDDIDNMLQTLSQSADRFDSIVSIGEVGEHPAIMKRIAGDSIEPFCAELKAAGRRQDNEPAYFPYGVAYIVKTDVLLSEKAFYTKRCTFYKIERHQRYEVDDLYDFLCIESVMKHRLASKV